MTAVLAERRSIPMAPRAGMSTDLWFHGQQDPTAPMGNPPDPERYIVWVEAGRDLNRHQRNAHGGPLRRSHPELAPRKALHVGLRPSLGLHDCDGCRP